MVQPNPTQHSTAQHSTAQHSTAQHSTAQHSTIQSKRDLKYFLRQDKLARFGSLKVGIFHYLKERRLWRFQVHLRMAEYHHNKGGVWHKIPLLWHKWRKNRLGAALGWLIPLNTFGPGLCIVHPGTVVVNDKARIGANARVHVCVNIGPAPHIGDDLYIGPGAKLFGEITLGNHVKIGANAVVNKSFASDGITLVGIPARPVSKKSE